MEKIIIEFITKQKTASICCLDDLGNPFCFTVFFVFDPVAERIYFKSSNNSKHAGFLQKNKKIAGTILPDKLNLAAIKGVQFTGQVNDDVQAAKEYHKKFPFALAMPGDVWTIDLESIKMTDNTLGFGKKIHWEKEGSVRKAV